MALTCDTTTANAKFGLQPLPRPKTSPGALQLSSAGGGGVAGSSDTNNLNPLHSRSLPDIAAAPRPRSAGRQLPEGAGGHAQLWLARKAAFVHRQQQHQQQQHQQPQHQRRSKTPSAVARPRAAGCSGQVEGIFLIKSPSPGQSAVPGRRDERTLDKWYPQLVTNDCNSRTSAGRATRARLRLQNTTGSGCGAAGSGRNFAGGFRRDSTLGTRQIVRIPGQQPGGPQRTRVIRLPR